MAFEASREFDVNIIERVMVAPSLPSPKTTLQLSSIDKLLGSMFGNVLLVYNASATVSADPANVIREALSKVLVYYPAFAGRLRNTENGELEVECTGEGALFVEATVNNDLSVIGDLDDDNPSFKKMIFSLPLDTAFCDLHLLIVQVTHFTCGGFVVGISFHHNQCDGIGLGKFLQGMADIARGGVKPSLEPIWNRELVKFEDTMVWVARTRAFQIPHSQNVKIIFPVNMRRSFNPPLPKRYYGNAIGLASATDNVQDLLSGSIFCFAMIIKKEKIFLKENFISRIVTKPIELDVNMMHENVIEVGDWRLLGLYEVDFGWGDAVNISPVQQDMKSVVDMKSYFIFLRPSKNMPDGIKIRMVMPPLMMKPFKTEMESIIKKYMTK
ncbi:hypothetical protein KI387_040554, partial [Taxus chinensis]